VLIFHTMVGHLSGTDSMFRRDGYSGTESTFGVGGPEDGHDGELWQWQSILRQADAQWDGNAYANSVETADGGDPSRPWTPAQLDTLIRLTADWCRQTGNPCELVTAPTGLGIGYHRQFRQWNHDGHTCPGPVRERQLTATVIPGARRLLAPLKSNPYVKAAKACERGAVGDQVRFVSWALDYSNTRGTFDAALVSTVAAFQRKHPECGRVDGKVGPKTIEVLKRIKHH
jgi:hypothetical protein